MNALPSRFMRKTLMPDEKFIREARFHPMYTLLSLLTMVFCASVGFGVDHYSRRYLGYAAPNAIYGSAFVGFWLFFWMMLKKWTTEIILTDRRLLHKKGFFQVNVEEVDVEQLASDYVQQSLLGRIFDYGSLHIRCVEASDIWLPPIAHPYEFRNEIEKIKHAYREHYMSVGRLYKHGSVPHAEAQK